MWKFHLTRDITKPRAYPLIVLAAAVIMAGCSDEKPAQTDQQKAPAQVAVEQVKPKTVALDRVYAARAQAADDVAVRTRVQGLVLKRHYTEGSPVKAGSVLFQIDPAPFEARVQQVQADLNRAQAQERQAQREWTRTSALFKDNAVSARDRDEAQSALELAQAGVATAQAQLRDARIQLGYTQVKAPISGYAGMREVSEGNLVQAGDLLTTIRQLDPVHVVFSMPEADALAHRQRTRTSNTPSDQKLAASLVLSSGSTYEHKGVIDFMATAMDPRTGNLQARATFSNPQGILLPGQFVRVAFKGLEVPDTIIVPPQSIGQGPQGPTVYIVDEKNVAQVRSVKLGQNIQDGQIIAEGIKAGDRVVVDGMAKVKTGSPVTISQSVAKLASGAAP
jgi:membrane fusion protein (multidrug efflux system)